MKYTIEEAKEQFEKLLEEQMKRAEMMNANKEDLDFSTLKPIVIGVAGGDGIGPAITAQGKRVMEYLLADWIKEGKVVFKDIDNLTIEHRVEANQAIPDDVMAELKQCHVILKGPTTTPRKGDPWPNIESANVKMRKELEIL